MFGRSMYQHQTRYTSAQDLSKSFLALRSSSGPVQSRLCPLNFASTASIKHRRGAGGQIRTLSGSTFLPTLRTTRRACRAMASSTPMVEQIREKNEKYPVMIYAKSYCPFCGQVKGLFKKLQVDYQSVNLDEIHEGEEIQDELAGITGSSTVPQVFIGTEFVGGCDDVMKLNSSGQLKQMLDKAGVASV